MLWLVVCLMLFTQVLTVIWLFWLDAEFKAATPIHSGAQNAEMINETCD